MQNQCDLDQLAEELTLRREIDKWGDIYYYNEHDERHRVNGPAIIYSAGVEYWYQNGKLHRLDGPAIVWASGHQRWYIDGRPYTKEDFNLHPDVIAYAKSK